MPATEFIAEIGANHEGEAARAGELIRLAAAAGASVVKFQHYQAASIISREGFAALPPMAHQAGWAESVYETFARYAVPWGWTHHLAWECERQGVEFLSTPYSVEAVAHLNSHVRRWKVGSGDITHFPLLRTIGETHKPVLVGTGASYATEIAQAMRCLRGWGTPHITLLHCVTNYTGNDASNLTHAHLHDLTALPSADALGLSDHTRSLPLVLGAVALGATVIERHFTDDRTSHGPDHGFAMEPGEFRAMVDAVRELETALGPPAAPREPYANERETRIVQRRAQYVTRDIPAGTQLMDSDIAMLRPCPQDGLDQDWPPNYLRAARDLVAGQLLRAGDVLVHG